MKSYHDILDSYLSAPENSQVALAERVGKSQAAIHRYARGLRFPDADTARLIDQHSSGAVPFSAWQAQMMQRLGIVDDRSSVHAGTDIAALAAPSPGKTDEISPCAQCARSPDDMRQCAVIGCAHRMGAAA